MNENLTKLGNLTHLDICKQKENEKRKWRNPRHILITHTIKKIVQTNWVGAF